MLGMRNLLVLLTLAFVSAEELAISECHGHNLFMCADKTHCVSNSFVCDSSPDCDDGSDEWSCAPEDAADDSKNKHVDTKCPMVNEFRCDGLCVPNHFRCDGHNDCKDKSDELGCHEINEDDAQRHGQDREERLEPGPGDNVHPHGVSKTHELSDLNRALHNDRPLNNYDWSKDKATDFSNDYKKESDFNHGSDFNKNGEESDHVADHVSDHVAGSGSNDHHALDPNEAEKSSRLSPLQLFALIAFLVLFTCSCLCFCCWCCSSSPKKDALSLYFRNPRLVSSTFTKFDNVDDDEELKNVVVNNKTEEELYHRSLNVPSVDFFLPRRSRSNNGKPKLRRSSTNPEIQTSRIVTPAMLKRNKANVNSPSSSSCDSMSTSNDDHDHDKAQLIS